MRNLLISLLILSLLAACSTTAPESDPTPTPTPSPEVSAAADGAPDSSQEAGGEEEQFRARVASPADVQGVVTSVVGNEVTLKLIEPLFSGGAMRFDAENMPEDFDITQLDPENLPEGVTLPEGFDPNNMPEIQVNGDGGFEVTLPEDFDMGAMMERAEAFMAGEGGGMVGGEGGTPPAQGRRITGGDFSAMRGTEIEIEVTYTGDEISVTIPVGLLSATPDKKQIVMLWYDEDDEIINARVAGKAKE